MTTQFLPQLGADGRIVEGIVTTVNVDGTTNIAPMGPIVDREFSTFVFRPFKSSATFANLVRTRTGVLHVTDDVELIAAAAIGEVTCAALRADHPLVLAGACRWYRFEIVSIDDAAERATLVGHAGERGTERDFFGFNRAQHAVIEAAILATRVHLLAVAEILAELARLEILVNKTGAAAEHRAFELLHRYVEQQLSVAHEEPGQ